MIDSINFLESIYQRDLAPFSAHRIEIWGETFPTVEHAYQAARIKRGPERDEIKTAASPHQAWRLGQKYKSDLALQVVEFKKVDVMEELFRAKMAQHPDIVDTLKKSGDMALVKIIKTDAFWGTGPDGAGENVMGKLWMKLRKEILSDIHNQAAMSSYVGA